MAITMAAIAFAASKSMHDHDVFFDTDSGILGIDNRCTACISPYLEDFETAPDETTAAIKGFGGSKTHGARKGTIVWRFADDLGAVHTFRIPNSYYVPQAEYRLFSPQHWAQAYSSKREKMGCDTNGVRSTGPTRFTNGGP
jgi:hypothetical protein